LTTEGWMVVVCFRSNAGADGCEESTPVAFFHRGKTQTNEFEIKRNKAHGGCLGIERR
jgi:hypothetical protein